jgi:hypothetical protein
MLMSTSFGNLEKCTICTDRVLFLGYAITPQRIEVDHAKVEAIHGWPIPNPLTDAKFFRPCGVLSPFCEGFQHHCYTVE